jgi:hypothetical protein
VQAGVLLAWVLQSSSRPRWAKEFQRSQPRTRLLEVARFQLCEAVTFASRKLKLAAKSRSVTSKRRSHSERTLTSSYADRAGGRDFTSSLSKGS